MDENYLKKARDRYWNCGGKEKATECCRKNREIFSKDTKTHRNLSEKEKEAKGEY